MATLITPRSDSVIQHLNPLVMLGNLWRHRELIRQFTWREVEGRYKGSFLGLLWSLVNPLALLLVYTFLFGVVFRARWGSGQGSLGEYALIIFCGITAYTIFSEAVGRASGLIVAVPNYVKKVVFPLEVLAVVSMGAALFHGLVSLGILLAGSAAVFGHIPWTLPLLPLVALPLIFLSLGLSWFLASLGVFMRDIGYGVALVLQVLFFGTPIFYAVESLPEGFQIAIRLNPLASVVENFRRVVLWGRLPNWGELALWLLVTGVVMLLGYAWFMKTRKAFADVI